MNQYQRGAIGHKSATLIMRVMLAYNTSTQNKLVFLKKKQQQLNHFKLVYWNIFLKNICVFKTEIKT
jgi:hypothetical protein